MALGDLGYPRGMPGSEARHLKSDPLEEPDTDEPHAIVETPEHEVIDFDGCSPDEVDAKLHDFETWAS